MTIIDKLGVMPDILDEETAELVQLDLEGRGIVFRAHTEALRFAGETEVTGVELAGGETLVADAYIAATGVKPNVAFLERSGLDIGWGVRVDNRGFRVAVARPATDPARAERRARLSLVRGP